MKYTVLLLMIATSIAAAQTRRDVQIVVDSIPRDFIVSIPSSTPPPGGWPIVVMFHGTTGDGEKFYNISGWKEKGAAENFVTVFPSSLAYRFYDDTVGTQIARVTKWNCGESLEKLVADQTMKDDVRFVRIMIDTIVATLPIDRTRIYASGFSNGGVFVSKLAVDAGDIFAAVGPAGGAMNHLDSARAPYPVGILFSMGADDRNIVEAAGRSLPMNDTGITILGRAVRRYIACQGLDTVSTPFVTPLTYSRRFATPQPGAAPTEFIVVIEAGLDHNYPNGRNHPIVMADVLWEFFSRHNRRSTAVDKPAPPSVFGVYPHPASDHLVVEGSGHMEFALYSMIGHRVFSATGQRGRALRLPALPAGLYQAEVRSNGEILRRAVTITR
ncbi:MAG: hypothetical protein HY962_01930 [Ignavibacteriae bacterium]|nr:hypothetical protein [Ignavibacteriota bacterium]